jgi:hypothetical protein
VSLSRPAAFILILPISTGAAALRYRQRQHTGRLAEPHWRTFEHSPATILAIGARIREDVLRIYGCITPVRARLMVTPHVPVSSPPPAAREGLPIAVLRARSLLLEAAEAPHSLVLFVVSLHLARSLA